MIPAQYLQLNSIIHRWHPQAKLVAILALILSFSSITQLTLLPVIITITGVIYRLSELPLKFWFQRLRYLGLFVVSLVIFLPFFSGKTILVDWGWIALKEEGVKTSFLILTRLMCIFTLTLVLLATAPFLKYVKSLRNLGVSPVIIDMLLLSYRYLEELGAMLKKMNQAMRLRGFNYQKFNRRNFKLLAQLVGTLLIRSYEQSERVYQAMRLRGYGMASASVSLSYLIKIKQHQMSWIASVAIIFVSISLIVVQFYL